MDIDVLVVGAGPTGLMLADQLCRRGVRVSIVDRHAGPSLQTRALGVQARTLEIYAHLGIAERAIELGKRATGANLWARGRRAAWVPLADMGRNLSPYPYLLILGQDDNERLLTDLLRERGTAVQWNTELVGLTQGADRVVAKLKQADGAVREVEAAWVAGCDGAHSAVRELNGIAFQGAPYEHAFYVADTQMTGPMVQGEVNVYLWRTGFHLLFPMRGADHWRIVGIVPAALRDKDDLTLDELIPSIHREAGPGLSFQGCSWFSTYRIHHRRAERFRDRRCFLLGDAAHIHSPVGAQGMNTGLQDAYNLGWKLALVISGEAGDSLLDTYGDERIPIAERLLRTTDRGFSVVVSSNWLMALFRTRALPAILALAMKSARVRRFAFRTISQIGIRYPASRLSQALTSPPAGAPKPGDRFPWLHLKLTANGPVEDLFVRLDDARFALIVIGQPAPSKVEPDLDKLIRTHVIPADPANDRELALARIPQPAFYLLRPDGYIGLSGARLDSAALTRYFSERLNVPTSFQKEAS